MARLSCSVDNCSYNQNNCCCAGKIKMAGKGATNQENTCCGSFLDKSAYSNLAEFTSMRNESTDIACNAQNCSHNENCHCCLSNVEVGGTGHTNIYTETCCNSFEMQ